MRLNSCLLCAEVRLDYRCFCGAEMCCYHMKAEWLSGVQRLQGGRNPKQQSVSCVCSSSAEIDLVCRLFAEKYWEGGNWMSQEVFSDTWDSILEIWIPVFECIAQKLNGQTEANGQTVLWSVIVKCFAHRAFPIYSIQFHCNSISLYFTRIIHSAPIELPINQGKYMKTKFAGSKSYWEYSLSPSDFKGKDYSVSDFTISIQ